MESRREADEAERRNRDQRTQNTITEMRRVWQMEGGRRRRERNRHRRRSFPQHLSHKRKNPKRSVTTRPPEVWARTNSNTLSPPSSGEQNPFAEARHQAPVQGKSPDLSTTITAKERARILHSRAAITINAG
ncbi:hypothetical protein YC2023_028502 [Brassica napus]